MSLETKATEICRRITDHGHTAWWAGGSVRDRLLGRPCKDIDIATDAAPEEILGWFRDTKEVGKAFGVILVHFQKEVFEIATFREDSHYEDGRRPSSVSFCGPEEDARRRDFTINGLYYDPLKDEVIDYVGGRKDLEAGLIRAIGCPEERFGEDHLRLLRAVRFASVLGFEIETKTFEAIRKTAANVARISPERIRDELNRIWMESQQAGEALELLRTSGLLEVVLPELSGTVGQEQPPEFHPEGDVFSHIRIMLNQMKDRSIHLCYGVLLHDIAKPVTAKIGMGTDGKPRIRFDGHAQRGAEMAEDILTRLRFPNKDIEAICNIVRNHMKFMEVRRMKPAKLRRWMGAETFETEMALHWLDCESSHRKQENYAFVRKEQESYRDEPVLPPCWLTGHDLIALGIPKGPDIGRLLKEAHDLQLENGVKDREALLAWVKEKAEPGEGRT